MTVNLLHDRCDAADFARVLDEADPDAIVAQELAPSCADVISEKYRHHRLRPALDFVGGGIATRFEATFGEIDMPARPGSSATFEVHGTRVRLGGVHLLNPINFPWWSAARGRGKQLDGLFAWLDEEPSMPTVVAGDFNASPAWPAYKRVEEKLTDLIGQHAERRELTAEPTWGWRPGWPRMLRIDHVFGVGARAIAVEVRPVRRSDHAAVIVDLELTAPAPDQSPVPRSKA